MHSMNTRLCSNLPSNTRDVALQHWLYETLGPDTPVPVPLCADASFRRYFRLQDHGRSLVVMDAPPEHESPQSFVRIAELLVQLGFSAPRIIAQDLALGFLLLEDLGDRTYTRALSEGACETRLYQLAMETLLSLQQRTHDWPLATDPIVPPYDNARLLNEANLLLDWYLPKVTGKSCETAVRVAFEAAWHEVLPMAQQLPHALVLRDFHVDNLMVLPGRSGTAACGLLDFQDAVWGPVSYDVVSLLRDARRDVPKDLHDALLAQFIQHYAQAGLSTTTLEHSYWILGAQRTTKIIGIFTRLWLRDGKSAYLRHLARLWRLLDEELAHPALAPVQAWYTHHLPLRLRLTVPGITLT